MQMMVCADYTVCAENAICAENAVQISWANDVGCAGGLGCAAVMVQSRGPLKKPVPSRGTGRDRSG